MSVPYRRLVAAGCDVVTALILASALAVICLEVSRSTASRGNIWRHAVAVKARDPEWTLDACGGGLSPEPDDLPAEGPPAFDEPSSNVRLPG